MSRLGVLAKLFVAACSLGACGDSGADESFDAATDSPVAADDVAEAGDADRVDDGRDVADEARTDEATETRDDGGTETYDPDCHWDCFGYSECHDGIVTTWSHTPVPCAYWTGECPHHESYTCERGCRVDTDVIHDPGIDPREMCEEWRPKQVGDPCDDPTDCDPQVATVDADGTVTNVYLRCDLETGICVARDPPVVEDYLAQCGVDPSFDGPDTGAYGFVRTDVCSGGVCLIYEAETCVTQGCTIRCDSDDDCPMGSICRLDFYDWTPAGPGTEREVWCSVQGFRDAPRRPPGLGDRQRRSGPRSRAGPHARLAPRVGAAISGHTVTARGCRSALGRW